MASRGEGSSIFLGGSKILGGNMLISGEQQYVCLGCRFSKHKMTRYAENVIVMSPLATPMLAKENLRNFLKALVLEYYFKG